MFKFSRLIYCLLNDKNTCLKYLVLHLVYEKTFQLPNSTPVVYLLTSYQGNFWGFWSISLCSNFVHALSIKIQHFHNHMIALFLMNKCKHNM